MVPLSPDHRSRVLSASGEAHVSSLAGPVAIAPAQARIVDLGFPRLLDDARLVALLESRFGRVSSSRRCIGHTIIQLAT